MIPKTLHVFQIPSGKFKVLIWGAADGHIMDWRGTNYRLTPVTGQPVRGFKTIDEAKALLQEIETNPERKKQEFKRAQHVAGRFFGDSTVGYDFVD